ncbi:MAG: hypothetical protein IJY62_00885 [Clostridia bacterium]|nr:hypothetical protein [Clostridia bacterium]
MSKILLALLSASLFFSAATFAACKDDGYDFGNPSQTEQPSDEDGETKTDGSETTDPENGSDPEPEPETPGKTDYYGPNV